MVLSRCGLAKTAEPRDAPSVPLPRIILASASPRRQDLLREAGVSFDVVPADVPELHDPAFTARELSQFNAHRKARLISRRFPDRLVLGADTLVALGARIYGKPADSGEAFQMISELQGQTHEVVTGVCLLQEGAARECLFVEGTAVTFRPLAPADIRDYLDRIHPLDKAGAYAIQEHGDRIVAGILGSYANVVGLPVERVAEVLRAW
jgi:septum formation protein